METPQLSWAQVLSSVEEMDSAMFNLFFDKLIVNLQEDIATEEQEIARRTKRLHDLATSIVDMKRVQARMHCPEFFKTMTEAFKKDIPEREFSEEEIRELIVKGVKTEMTEGILDKIMGRKATKKEE